jgi:phage recombination protein Bet
MSAVLTSKATPANSPAKSGLNLSLEEIETLKKFVWQGCTDSELRFGLSVCQFLGLNPLMKHVIFIKSHGGGNLYTTRDGLLHMAHQSGQFNGMQSGVVYAHNKDGEIIKLNNRKVIEGAWCKVYRKDMDYPFEVEVNFEEYYRPHAQVWQQYPAAMIKKVAEHMALKLAFNVSGLSSVDEIGIEEKQLQDAQLAQENLERLRKQEKEAQASMKVMIETIRELQQKHTLSKEQIQEISGRETLKGLNIQELEEVVLRLSDYCLRHTEEKVVETTEETSIKEPKGKDKKGKEREKISV